MVPHDGIEPSRRNAWVLQTHPNPYGLMRDKTETVQTVSETLSTHGRQANGASGQSQTGIIQIKSLLFYH